MMTRKAFLQGLTRGVGASAILNRFPLLAFASQPSGKVEGSKKLMAGVARVKLTPTPGDLGDYAKSDPLRSSEVAQDIFARIIVLGNESGEKLLLLSADLQEIPNYNELTRRISAKYGINGKASLLCGTRNSQAIAPSSERTIVAKIEAAMLDAMVIGVGQAIAAMQPAKMALAQGTSDINVHYGLKTAAGIANTPDFSKFADKQLSVLRVDDLNGKTLALHVNYGMQSGMMQGSSKKISGDLAGSISAYVERRLGCICAWTIGAAAEVYPIALSSMSSPIYNPDGKVIMEKVVLSEEIAGKLCAYLTSTQSLDILRVTGKIARFSELFSMRADEHIYTAAGRRGPVQHRLHLVVINDDFAFAAANSITSAGLGKLVKDALPYRTVFLSSEGNTVGYVVDADTDPQGVAGANSVAVNAWDSEREYVNGFRQLAHNGTVKG